MAAALELKGIYKKFGDYAALAGANFELRRGEVHALLGENGAGKTSLMNIAAGLYAPDAGSVFVGGQSARLRNPRDASRLRIGMVHQHFKLVHRFTVAENVLLTQRGGRFSRNLKDVSNQIRSKCTSLGFVLDPKRVVHDLSLAEQQRLEIIKILLASAEVLIFDEPTAVLTDDEARSLLSMLRTLAKGGVSIVLVTHKLADVIQFADSVTVMRGGRNVATLDPKQTTKTKLAELVIGGGLTEIKSRRGDPRDIWLSASDVVCSGNDGRLALRGATFTVRAGEIYGIAGISGNGQTELAEILMGAREPESGAITINSVSAKAWTSSALRASGVSFIPADRYRFGLAGTISVRENFGIGGIQSGLYGTVARVDSRAMERAARSAVDKFDVQGIRGLGMRAALLSGGNAQKLVLARELSRQPKLIVAHAPTRGLDVRACAFVHEQLLHARDSGAAVLVISDDLDELLLVSDRIGVMNRGKIAAEFDASADRQEIGNAMIEHD